MPFNVPALNVMLNALDITHVGLHTLTDPGTATNALAGEVSGGAPAYARQPVTMAAAASGTKANSGALTFDVPAATTVGFLTFWTALTGNVNNFRGYAPIGSTTKGFFSADPNLANDTLFSVAHGMADGDRVMLLNVFAETLPTGLAEGTIYFVVSSASNSFKVSLTSGGAPVDITALGGGEGYFQKLVPETFVAQGQLTVDVSALVHDLTGV